MRRFGMSICLLALGVAAQAQTGWGRYRVYANNAEQVRRITDSDLGLFSDNVAMPETDLIVGPGELKKLFALRLNWRYIAQLPDPRNWDQQVGPDAIDFHNQYYRYSDILAQYEEWRASYPDVITRVQIATTVNGRPLYAYRFFNNPSGDRQIRNSFVMICGIHAREWIAPAVGLHIFSELVRSYFTRTGFSQTVPLGTAFYMVPVFNPDGYEYTWTNNRLWRKNRRNNGNGTFGVDLNRNFSKGWGLNSGSSGNTNSETYRGPAAFSEPETAGLRDYLNTLTNVSAFIDFHSYGQYVLYPWGYQSTLAPGDSWLNQTGALMDSAIEAKNGMTYTMGPTSTTLYLASGVSPDYVYDKFNAAAYTIELRDTGQDGFILPTNQIYPTQLEAWEGFQALVLRMLNR